MAQHRKTPLAWLVNDGMDATFVHAVACAITSLSPATLQNWANREITELVVQKPERGGRRLYSAWNLVIIALAGELVEAGLDAKDAVRAAGRIWTDLIRQLKPEETGCLSLAGSAAIIEGASMVHVALGVKKSTLPFDRLFAGKPVVFYACGPRIAAVAADCLRFVEAEESAATEALARRATAEAAA